MPCRYSVTSTSQPSGPHLRRRFHLRLPKNSSTTLLARTRYPIRVTSLLSGQSGSLAETTLDTQTGSFQVTQTYESSTCCLAAERLPEWLEFILPAGEFLPTEVLSAKLTAQKWPVGVLRLFRHNLFRSYILQQQHRWTHWFCWGYSLG